MWFEMRKESLGFVERAPAVHVAEGEVRAARAAVFAALVDPWGWKSWFPNVREASYTSPPPYGVGTIREADVGGTRWVEEIVAWDEDTRWAWTVVRTSLPFATAQVESFEIEGGSSCNGTLLRRGATEHRGLGHGRPLRPGSRTRHAGAVTLRTHTHR